MKRYTSLEERIIANSVLSRDHHYAGEPCWEWIGKVKINASGNKYAHINIWRDGKLVSFLVHRLVLWVFRGIDLWNVPIAMHLCNNTLCVNPMHIESGTQSQNIKQCIADGRHNNFGKVK